MLILSEIIGHASSQCLACKDYVGKVIHSLLTASNNWCEPERAQHRRDERTQSMFGMYVHSAMLLVRPSPTGRHKHYTSVSDIF